MAYASIVPTPVYTQDSGSAGFFRWRSRASTLAMGHESSPTANFADVFTAH